MVNSLYIDGKLSPFFPEPSTSSTEGEKHFRTFSEAYKLRKDGTESIKTPTSPCNNKLEYCDVCNNFLFISEADMERHWVLIHGGFPTHSYKNRPKICKFKKMDGTICGESFVSQYFLNHHKKQQDHMMKRKTTKRKLPVPSQAKQKSATKKQRLIGEEFEDDDLSWEESDSLEFEDDDFDEQPLTPEVAPKKKKNVPKRLTIDYLVTSEYSTRAKETKTYQKEQRIEVELHLQSGSFYYCGTVSGTRMKKKFTEIQVTFDDNDKLWVGIGKQKIQKCFHPYPSPEPKTYEDPSDDELEDAATK